MIRNVIKLISVRNLISLTYNSHEIIRQLNNETTYLPLKKVFHILFTFKVLSTNIKSRNKLLLLNKDILSDF